ncbi:MAG: hypothetical protein ING02_14385 [Roseomonas sp.]|nr:hypothetical protein [Roseomonas sp.]
MQRALFPKDGLPKHLRDDFDIFWAAYPPRQPNPRALAEVAYARAVREGLKPDDLARAAARYSDEVRAQKIEPAFVVHAATFLRQRRFLDYLTSDAPAPEAAPRQVDEAHPLRAVTRGRISDADFIAWIAKLEIAVWEKGQRAVLTAPTAFHRDWVRNYLSVELRAWMQVRVLEIHIRHRQPQAEGAAP